MYQSTQSDPKLCSSIPQEKSFNSLISLYFECNIFAEIITLCRKNGFHFSPKWENGPFCTRELNRLVRDYHIRRCTWHVLFEWEISYHKSNFNVTKFQCWKWRLILVYWAWQQLRKGKTFLQLLKQLKNIRIVYL